MAVQCFVVCSHDPVFVVMLNQREKTLLQSLEIQKRQEMLNNRFLNIIGVEVEFTGIRVS